ncbi:MAG: hypothetical protein LBR50_02335 [Tannerella sp.]|jgi:hypothetical protein|nr:hypothetical protein [Tannerella sp.]
MQENDFNPRMTAGAGCWAWIPVLSLLICRFVFGMPKDANKVGLVSYLCVFIFGNIWLIASAMYCRHLGMALHSLVFWIGEIIWLVLTIYVIALL